MNPPPPRLRGSGEDDAERVADGDGGIDRVAALLQDVDADFGGEMLARDDDAVARTDGRRRGCVRADAPNDHGERKQDTRSAR